MQSAAGGARSIRRKAANTRAFHTIRCNRNGKINPPDNASGQLLDRFLDDGAKAIEIGIMDKEPTMSK
jgi:hypothetical protein